MTRADATILVVMAAIPIVALAMLWLGMFVDILITKSDVWLAAGHDRFFCLLLVVGLGPIGAISYGIFVRPQLARMEAKVAGERVRRAGQWAKDPLAAPQ